MVLHVDGEMMIGKDMKEMNEILDKINNKFKITRQQVSSDPVSYLGMQITSSSKGTFINKSM